MILSNVEIPRTGSSTWLAVNQVGNYEERDNFLFWLHFLLAGTETCQVCVATLRNSLSTAQAVEEGTDRSSA